MIKTLDIAPRKLVTPMVVMVIFWILAISLWQATGYLQSLLLFGYIGTSLGLGLGLYGALPKRQKPIGRRIALFLVGAFLVFFVAGLGQENIQFEGLVFGLLTGVVQAGVVHYLIAKLVGPLVFGRLWCGWACWTVMVLDLLPFTRSQGRLPRKFGWIRHLHLLLSAGMVLLLVQVFDYTAGGIGASGLVWFAAGNMLYFALGIGLAYALKDNRAFCKYVCPVAVVLKITSRFSLLKIQGDPARCDGCLACEKLCPMDVRITGYIHDETRVLSTECSLCQTCISTCSKDALKMSVGLDLGGREYLNARRAA
jgi:polyferredoxin